MDKPHNHQPSNYQPPPELLLQSAINSMPSHIAMLNEGGSIISINTAWQRFGDANEYTDNAYGMGRNYINICESASGEDAEEAQRVAYGIRSIINEKSDIFRIEYPCHSPDVRRWFTLQIARFEWEGELRVMTAHQNITDLKLAQEAFAQSQKRLQAVVDHVVDGIFTTDERGFIETINPAVCEIFGFQPEQLVGTHFSNLLQEPYRTQYTRYVNRHREVNGQRYAEVGHEVKGIRKSGMTFPIYMAMSRAYLGNRWIFTGIVQDLTPRKHIEAERIEKERLRVELDKERELRELKNRFMSMISHELRTPLSVIMLSSDFLRRYSEKMSNEEKLEAIATVQTQVRHLENMVDDVSALSRADSLETSIRTEAVNLIDLCGDIVANAQMLAGRGHKIIFESNDLCIDILGDTKLLRQAITNLLGNAIKYSLENTHIYLKLMCNSESIIIQVIDNGIGIPAKDQQKLFEPFHRASNVDVRPGTGLGLAVTKRAIELHGGKISFHSVENEGTTFTIVIPLNNI